MRELDVVELTEEVDGWPAGTVGTIVSTYPGGVVIEVPDPEHSFTTLLDLLITVPLIAVRRRDP